MTTEIEKTFFETFGIEKIIPCYKCSMQNTNWDCKRTCLYDDEKRKEYSQITDRILLELICICSQYGFCPTARNIKDLKLKVLKRLFKLKKNLKNNYENQCYYNTFTRKVCTLFKE